MIIRVKIYAYLRYYLPAPDKFTQDEEWDMPEETTIGQVLEKLDLPEEIRIIVLLNGRSADQETALNEGDVVHILPQIAGG
jgi:molybdopterin converting factor small subunit